MSAMSVFFVFGAKVSAETISVVSDTAYAPFEFKDSDQTYKGIDVDIINEVAKRKNWDVNQTFPGFDAAVNAVQSGQADALMAGTTVTDARKKVFTFSDTYYDTSIVIYTRSSDKVSDYKQLKGKTVGVKNGTAAQTWLDKNASKYGFTVKTFDTSDLMNNSLDSGSVDAAMDDTPVVKYAIGQGKDYAINIKPESIGSFAFAVKKGGKHENLIKDFNEALKEMKKDGTYDKIMNKWLGDSEKSSSSKPSADLKLTGDANAKATPAKETYTISMDSSFAPFEYQNGSGKYVGIDVDIINAIAKNQGFNVKLTNPGFDASLNAVQSSQADAVLAGMTITDARKQIFDFSDPYYETQNAIIVRKDQESTYSSLDAFKGKKVAVQKGTIEEGLAKKQLKDSTVVSLTAMGEAINEVKSGQVDAVDLEKPVAEGYVAQNPDLALASVALKVDDGDAKAVAMAKGNDKLKEAVNKVIKKLKDNGTYDEYIKDASKYTAVE